MSIRFNLPSKSSLSKTNAQHVRRSAPLFLAKELAAADAGGTVCSMQCIYAFSRVFYARPNIPADGRHVGDLLSRTSSLKGSSMMALLGDTRDTRPACIDRIGKRPVPPCQICILYSVLTGVCSSRHIARGSRLAAPTYEPYPLKSLR